MSGQPEPPRICVIDDDRAVRDSVRAILDASGFAPEGYGDGRSFLADLAPGLAACAVLDVRLPDMSGLDVLRQVMQRVPELPVVIITGHGDVPMAVEAMRIGAKDFFEKPFDGNQLIASIRRAIAAGPTVVERAIPLNDDARERIARLTPREHDVLGQLVIGHPNKVIARNLGLSPRTVELHRSRVMKKTGATSLPHLVRMALSAGFEPPAEPDGDSAFGPSI